MNDPRLTEINAIVSTLVGAPAVKACQASADDLIDQILCQVRQLASSRQPSVEQALTIQTTPQPPSPVAPNMTATTSASGISARPAPETMLTHGLGSLGKTEFPDLTRMLQCVLNCIPIRVFWKDTNSRMLGYNQLFADDSGAMSVETLAGKNAVDLITEHTEPLWQDPEWQSITQRYEADDRKVIETGIPLIGIEEDQLRADQKVYRLRTNKYPLRNEEGTIIGIIGMYEDITEQKQTEDALKQKQDEEQELQRYFVALHDISIELTLTDSLNEFCRRTVALGLERLGFDRLGMHLYDASRNMSMGTYGTDVNGNIVDEAHLQIVLEPHGSFWHSLLAPDRFFFDASAVLVDNFHPVGVGQGIVVALRQGTTILGWLAADNLIHQRPFSRPHQEAFAQFGLYVSAALAHKQAVEALREHERFLRTSQIAGQIGSFAFNIPEGTWRGSPMLYEIFGIDEAFEKNTETWLGLVHPEMRDEAAHNLRNEVLTGGIRLDMEYHILRHRDQSERWVHAIGELEFDERKQPIRIIGTVQDITRRKQDEQALQLTTARLYQSVQVGKIGIFDHDFLSDTLYWSPEQRAIFGFTLDEVVTVEKYLAHVHPDDYEWVKNSIERPVENDPEERSDIEVRIIDRNGNIHWLSTRSKTIFENESGAKRPIRRIGAVIDITERKRQDEALRLSEERLRLALDAANMGTWEWSIREDVIHWSEQVATIFGVPYRKFVEHYRNYVDLIYQPDRLLVIDSVEKALSGKTSNYEVVHRIQRSDGSIHWLEGRGRVYRDQSGQAVFMAGTVMDITERKRAEAEIRHLNSVLEQRVIERTKQYEIANRELESFAYSVSHDLRAPLRAIDGFSVALLEDFGQLLNAQGRDFLNRVRQNAQRMEQIINDLLQLSRVTRRDLTPQAVNLSALATQIVSLLRESAPQRTAHIDIQPNIVVTGDRGLIHILLENLLGNAWKFSSHRPTTYITFGVMQENGQQVFFVRDNGAGFDMSHAGKLFGAFQRLHRADEFEGTGIGLATSFRIVQRHQGRIWAEAAVGEGATFYFTLGNDQIV